MKPSMDGAASFDSGGGGHSTKSGLSLQNEYVRAFNSAWLLLQQGGLRKGRMRATSRRVGWRSSRSFGVTTPSPVGERCQISQSRRTPEYSGALNTVSILPLMPYGKNPPYPCPTYCVINDGE